MNREKFKFTFSRITTVIIALLAVVGIFFAANTNIMRKRISLVDSEMMRSAKQEERRREFDLIENEGDEYVDGNQGVYFGAFFAKDLDGDGRVEKILGTSNDINGTDTLFINLGVSQTGYLKEGAKITIAPKEGNFSNFRLQMNMFESDILDQNYLADNVTSITLKQIDAGMQGLISGSIHSNVVLPADYSRDSMVTLNGIYVDNQGHETAISKTWDLTVDWDGVGTTSINTSYPTYDITKINPNHDIVVNLSVTASTYGLINKERYIQIQVPDLFGYYPQVKNLDNMSDVDFDYDENTHILTINTETTNQKTTHNIKLTYPKEVYPELNARVHDTVSYTIYAPISGYAVCYNNPNEQFENPYTTETVNTRAAINFYIDEQTQDEFIVNAKISPTTWLGAHDYGNGRENDYGWSKKEFLELYDSENDEIFTYTVTADTYRNRTASEGYTPKRIEQKEDLTQFGGYNGENFVKTKSIKFLDTTALTPDGWVKIYNQKTGDLIKEFTNREWLAYSNIPYEFEEDVSYIRIETSEDDNTKNGRFNIQIQKEIDIKKMKEEISRAELESISTYRHNIVFTAYEGEERGDVINCNCVCQLYSTRSYADIKASEEYIMPTQDTTPVPVTLTIDVPGDTEVVQALKAPWVNGKYVVTIKKSNVIDCAIDNITSTNPNIEIVDYSIDNSDPNVYIIRINTNNLAETNIVTKEGVEITTQKPEDEFKLNIYANVTLNPISEASVINVNLYSYNEYQEMYPNQTYDIYDIDNDGNMQDYVGITSTGIQLVAQNNFRTTETLTHYSGQENEQEIFAPNTGDILQGINQATINIVFANGYDGDITNLKILGKIPFEGNTYIDGEDLHSEYTTTMTSKGITIPEALRENTRVYYSEEESPSYDITDPANGWKTKDELSSFDNVKTYLIVVEDENIRKNQVYRMSYNVNIPDNVDVNQVAYACCKADFDVYVNDGLLHQDVQPGRLGLRIAEYYGMEIDKFKEDTTKPISNIYFQLLEYKDGEVSETKLLKTNNEGKLLYDKLRLNQVYGLREINGGSYIAKEGIIKFRVVNNGNNVPTYELMSDSEEDFDGEVTLRQNQEGRYVLKTIIYNIPKARISLQKVDSITGNPIEDVTFGLYAEGENSSVYKTNAEGKISFFVKPNVQYRLVEHKNDGYYAIQDLVFTVRKENGNYIFDSDNRMVTTSEVINANDTDYLETNVVLENDRIPTYGLEIRKVDEDRNTPLEGVTFLLTKEDDRSTKTYTTDENGIIDISDLYEYVEGREITGKYILQEIATKEGYLLNDEKIKFYVTRDFEEKLQIHLENENEIETVKDVNGGDDSLAMTIANKPLFKVIKIDDDNGNRIPNVQFILYSLDEDGEVVDYAKDIYGEYLGVKNSDGQYILTTNENGEISAPLLNGKYKLIEITFPEGYQEVSKVEYFTVDANSTSVEETQEGQNQGQNQEQDSKIRRIRYIEDLVDMSMSSNNYSGYVFYLDKTLDFEDDSSYKNPETTVYGDLNGNGEVQTLKEELTDRNGTGFAGIARFSGTFAGTFDGQNNEIKNIYMNKNNTTNTALFLDASYATIKNLGVSGNYKTKLSYHVAGIVGNGYYVNIENCYSKVDIDAEDPTYVAGICARSSNTNTEHCYNEGNINVKFTLPHSYYVNGVGGTSNRCYNTGNINVEKANETGSVSVAGVGSGTNCYNRGNITVSSEGAGVHAYGVGNLAKYSYNTGNIIVNGTPIAETISPVGEDGYYLSTITLSSEEITGNCIAKTSAEMQSIYFVNDLGRAVWKMDESNVNDGYPVLLDNVDYLDYGGKIEFLVRLSQDAQHGITYAGKEIKINTNLDFQDDHSYKNPEDTSFGDLNGDGIVKGIKEELTDVNGKGFTPISNFQGTFNAQNYRIDNLYINASGSDKVALFETAGSVENLKISGTVKADNCNYVAGILASETGIVKNCYSDIDIEVSKVADNGTTVSGISNGSTYFCANSGDIDVQVENGSTLTVNGVSTTTNIGFNKGNVNVNTQTLGELYVYGIGRNTNYSYNTGDVNVATTAVRATVDAVGENVQNGFYRSEATISGTTTTNGIAKNEAYMKQNEFVQDLSDRYWKLEDGENDGYPVFKSEQESLTLEVNCIEDLIDIGNDVLNKISYQGANIKLNKDLDFASRASYRNPDSTEYGDLNGNGTVESIMIEMTTGAGYRPIGTINEYYQTCFFEGNFDGQGYTIDNLYYSGRSYAGISGIFGAVNNSTIKNITVKGSATDVRSNSGAICGKATGNVTIENCTSYCNFTTSSSLNNIGSMVGSHSGEKLTVTNCNNYGSFTVEGGSDGSSQVGGLVGIADNATINNCNNHGNISLGSGYQIGGLVGQGSTIDINNSYNFGNISGINGNYGGIIGNGTGTITSSGNEGNITISNPYNVGGLVGQGSYYIDNSYNKGSISVGNGRGSSEIAGILAQGSGTITNTWNEGKITVIRGESYYVSGIKGRGTATILSCYNTGDIEINESEYIDVAGVAQGGIITDSYNSGNITSNSSKSIRIGGIAVGGLVGGTISNSYNTGNLEANNSTSNTYIGGIAANNATIDKCFNTGFLKLKETSEDVTYVGGIVGSTGTVSSSYNAGNIDVDSPYQVFVGGVVGTGSANTSYNKGNIDVRAGLYVYVGGIIGSGSADSSYNNGNLDVYGTDDVSGIYIGGVSGSGSDSLAYNTGNVNYRGKLTSEGHVGGVTGQGKVTNGYNFGNVEVNVDKTGSYALGVGGIAGSDNGSNYVYNVGNVVCNGATDVADNIQVGPIYGNTNNTVPEEPVVRVYADDIRLVGDDVNLNGEGQTISYLKSNDMYDRIKVGAPDNWRHERNQYSVLDLPVFVSGADKSTEITVRNTPLKYEITTEVGKNKDGIRAGGTISGDDSLSTIRKYVETISYGGTSTEAIEVVPAEGYKIVSISINGELYDFDTTQNTPVTIPAGYFTDVKRNYHVVAVFDQIDAIFTINKVDDGGDAVKGAVFSIDELETRQTPDSSVIGPLTDDGPMYDTEQYNFREIDGKFVSTNQGVANRSCRSYVIVDLTGLTGKYKINVNAELQSNSANDYAYIDVTSEGRSDRLCSLRDTTSAQDYSVVVDGGTNYRVELVYNTYTDAEQNVNDTFTINSVNVELDDSNFYHANGLKTNSKGQILTSLRSGKYRITETSAPDAYVLNPDPQEIIIPSETNTIEIVNHNKCVVTAHYLLDGTGPEFGNEAITVAEDQTLYGIAGEAYQTTAELQIGEYKLKKDAETGEYVIPTKKPDSVIGEAGCLTGDAVGEFTIEPIDVYYYYQADLPEGSFKLSVTKQSTLDDSKVEGAEFEVYYVDGENESKVGTLQDKGDGLYESENMALPSDGELKYVLKETVVPDGYLPVDDIDVTLTVELDELNNKYSVVGTTFGSLDAESLQAGRDVITGIIYETPADLNYEVHYFLDGVEAEELAETNLKATLGSKISTYTDKRPDGYMLEKEKALNEGGVEVDLPLTIKADESKNIINVYYIKTLGFYKFDVTKINKDNPTVMVEGAEFDIYEVNGDSRARVGTLVDKGNGKYESESIQVDHDGTINVVLVETNIPDGYMKVDDIEGTITFVLDEDSGTYRISDTTFGRVNAQDGGTISFTVEEPPRVIYDLIVRYVGGEPGVDEAKISVESGTVSKSNYTQNGELYIGEVELTNAGTESYTVFEEETPEYCRTVVDVNNPGVVDITKQINTQTGEYEFVINQSEIEGFDVIVDDDTKQVIIQITTEKNIKYDLSLQKFITNIDGEEVTDRIPSVTVTPEGKIEYSKPDELKQVANNQQITYTIRMYNESQVRATGKQVIEYIPDGLVFVPESNINKEYEWKMYKVGKDGKPELTTNPEEAVLVMTNYLEGKDIKAFDMEQKQISYLDVKVVFKVDESKITSADRIVENEVQIMPSVFDENTGNDKTTEKVYVKYFDLKIEKYIEEVKINTKGVETVRKVGYEQKGQLVKIDVKRSEAKDTKITVTYGLLIKNVGEIPGYASELTDYIPENFELKNNNGEWTENGNKAISTSLQDKLLNPGESTVATITFEWNLANGKVGTRRNEAEITKYANQFGSEDITKDNKDGEDLLVTLKTGSETVKGITVVIAFASIVALGIFEIRKRA